MYRVFRKHQRYLFVILVVFFFSFSNSFSWSATQGVVYAEENEKDTKTAEDHKESSTTTEEKKTTTEAPKPTTEEKKPTTEESKPTTEERKPTTETSQESTTASKSDKETTQESMTSTEATTQIKTEVSSTSTESKSTAHTEETTAFSEQNSETTSEIKSEESTTAEKKKSTEEGKSTIPIMPAKKIDDTIASKEESAEDDDFSGNIIPKIYNDTRLAMKNNKEYIAGYIYFNQGDSAWNQNGYYIAKAGCGPTSMAVVISTLTGQWVTPIDTTLWAYGHGYYSRAGSSHELIPAISQAYGLNCNGLGTSYEAIRNALRNHHPVVCLMGPGYFTRGGHFMVLVAIDDQDQVTVADVGSRRRSAYKYYLRDIIAQSKSASAGGPFWEISKPEQPQKVTKKKKKEESIFILTEARLKRQFSDPTLMELNECMNGKIHNSKLKNTEKETLVDMEDNSRKKNIFEKELTLFSNPFREKNNVKAIMTQKTIKGVTKRYFRSLKYRSQWGVEQ